MRSRWEPTVPIQRWSRERAGELAALAAAALPSEDLSEDELLASCWDDLAESAPDDSTIGAGAVLATEDGSGAVSVVVRPALGDGPPVAYVQLLTVHPDAHRTGLGHELLAAAEAFAWACGAGELRLEGAPPFYLWPGVDERFTAMRALAGSRGYEELGTDVNMALPSLFRAPPPNAIDVRRVIEETDREATRALVERVWPEWWAEVERAIEHGCCHGAFAAADDEADDAGGLDVVGVGDEIAVGFACHSVSRAGWLGPMGTDPRQRTRGIGQALLAQVCRDLMVAEYASTEICWAGPQGFYAKAGATISRTFVRYRLRRPA